MINGRPPLQVKASKFEDSHVEPMLALMQRAFSIVPEHSRPKDSPAFLSHMLSDANPSGQALMVLAQEDGRLVGSVSAIPMRFRRLDGRIVIGYQIGYFVVDSSVQRQGVGKQLINCLTEALGGSSEDFVYGYPNTRSIGLFDSLHFDRLQSVPTRIHLPTLAMIATAGSGRIRVGGFEAGWKPALPKEIAQTFNKPDRQTIIESQSVGFIRDAAYFQWRFLGPDAERRYSFARVQFKTEEHVLALAEHTFKGLRFAVLADVLPALTQERYKLIRQAAQAAGWSKKAGFLYLNTALGAQGGSGVLSDWSIDVPERFNPRPVKLILHPDTTAVSADELRQSLVMTADWMGF